MEDVVIFCGIITLITLILTLYSVTLYFLTSTFNFWESRGIHGPRPRPIFGNLKDVIFTKISIGDYLTKIYNDYKEESFIGIFQRRTPVLIVKDPDIIKDILIKDFSVFSSRGLNIFEKTEPLTQNLFMLEPKRWRPLRAKLSPVFTSGKLKEMFFLISVCTDHLVQYIDKVASRNEPIEFCELTAKYGTDVIGSCAFGIEMNALTNENSEFRKMGKKIFNTSKIHRFRQMLGEFFPRFYNILGNILPQLEITKFFTRIILETMEYREINNISKNDFVDALLELKKYPDKLGDINLTDSLIASQALAFFVGSYETTSTTITHALYELALNQKIQDKLREEINEVYAKYDGDLSYYNIKGMDYLDKVYKETLRKYPALTTILRQSTSSYTFDGTRVTIPKDQKVWIPVYAIHRDAEIYPEPDTFDPERFNKEAVQSRHPMFYLPFGSGPRNCIGTRFAIYQNKIGLIKILWNYKVEICENTPIPYRNGTTGFLLFSKDKIYLKIIKINVN